MQSEDELVSVLENALIAHGSRADIGEEFQRPELDVLRYFWKRVRLNRLPFVGHALSLVAVVRQPADLPATRAGSLALIGRIGAAINGRYPPWSRHSGLSVGLTVVIVSREPIAPGDEETLGSVLNGSRTLRSRAQPLAIVRVHLEDEAMAIALGAGPDGLFPEPKAVADALTPRLGRHLPPMSW